MRWLDYRYQNTFILQNELILGVTAHKEGRSHSQGGTKFQKVEFLMEYADLISCQIKSNCVKDAMKTFKKIKYFKLDSMNAKDVENALEPLNQGINNRLLLINNEN